jgi:dihydrolipoamide dehydrogenase
LWRPHFYLELDKFYGTLGASLNLVEMMDGLMQGADCDLVKIWQKMNAPRFAHSTDQP